MIRKKSVVKQATSKKFANPQPSKKTVIKHGSQFVTKDGEVSQKKLKAVRVPEAHAEVRVGIGSTLSMGQYESLRIAVDIMLPCDPNDIEATFEEASEFAGTKLDTLIRQFKPGAASPSKKKQKETTFDDDEEEETEEEEEDDDDEVEDVEEEEEEEDTDDDDEVDL